MSRSEEALAVLARRGQLTSGLIVEETGVSRRYAHGIIAELLRRRKIVRWSRGVYVLTGTVDAPAALVLDALPGSASAVARSLGVTRSRAVKRLHALQADGLVVRTGSRRWDIAGTRTWALTPLMVEILEVLDQDGTVTVASARDWTGYSARSVGETLGRMHRYGVLRRRSRGVYVRAGGP